MLGNIVLDNGSGSIKAGMGGYDSPAAVIPAVVGHERLPLVIPSASSEYKDKKRLFVGEQAQKDRGVLSLSYPIEHGKVVDWDGMEALWHHTFYNELRVDPKSHRVLLTEAPMNPTKNRERMIELMFETFEVPYLVVKIQAILSLFASGATTGTVLDSGDGVTHIVPIYQGYKIDVLDSIKRLNFAGRDVTDYLQQLLQRRGSALSFSVARRELSRDIKEKLSYCALDYDEELSKAKGGAKDVTYELPDGSEIVIGSERFMCAEALFNPKIMSKEIHGIHEEIYDSIMKTDIHIRRDLFKNIVLSGGTTMIPNFETRLYKELSALTPPSTKVKIKASPERRWAVWKGGSTLTQLTSFDSMWVSRDEYDEKGVEKVVEEMAD
ncbi:Actin [Aduncisulcus paluster]|uniref:Actin n=1 Tax=Aduncisulcus paluster TaxID=2918883 RepID=A0ABQ5JVM6_9EUKA|nr:Actin [Aduncisulcus paluster]